jgi:colanic acid biosynthesis glycosyl transferase WcaI
VIGMSDSRRYDRPRNPSGPRIAIMMHDFHPNETTNARLLLDCASAMMDRGYQIEVYAAQPKPSVARNEVMSGVKVRRFFSPQRDHRKVIGRLINTFTVSFLMFWRLLFVPRPAVLLVDTTSPFIGPVAWLLHVLRGWKYVYLATELYPDAAVALGYLKNRGIIDRIWDASNRLVYGAASSVIVIGPLLRDRVARHLPGGAEDPRLVVIHNWADGNSIKPVPIKDNPFRQEHGWGDKIVILYSGNMGLSHDLETVVSAAGKVRDLERIQFVFIGNGPKRAILTQMTADLDLENVAFLPYQPTEVLPFSLSSGDLSIVTLGSGMDRLTIPSKLYPALAAGQAILALSGEDTDLGGIVTEYGFGVRITPGAVDDLASMLRTVDADNGTLKEMKRRAREAFETEFTREISTSAYAEVLRRAAGLKQHPKSEA